MTEDVFNKFKAIIMSYKDYQQVATDLGILGYCYGFDFNIVPLLDFDNVDNIRLYIHNKDIFTNPKARELLLEYMI